MRVAVSTVSLFLIFGPLTCLAQDVLASPAAPLPGNVVAVSAQWVQLSNAQKLSLHPLASTWDTLSNRHQKKWLALAKNYPSMAPAEQAKLHSRMAEWAALKPSERELARLNFVETKKLQSPDRAANWETYKALTPEERKKLAKTAASKPAGAAVAIKPVAVGKLAPIPVTRHTPQQLRLQESAKGTIDRNTLLPIHPPSRSN